MSKDWKRGDTAWHVHSLWQRNEPKRCEQVQIRRVYTEVASVVFAGEAQARVVSLDTLFDEADAADICARPDVFYARYEVKRLERLERLAPLYSVELEWARKTLADVEADPTGWRLRNDLRLARQRLRVAKDNLGTAREGVRKWRAQVEQLEAHAVAAGLEVE